jgi:glycerophosphoryl diester phosphodiesterase
VLVTSFDRDAITRVHHLDDRLATGQLDAALTDRVEFVTRAAAAGNVAVHPWFGFVDGELVRAAHDLGLAVNPWTVDDPDQLDTLIALGVDGIITNVPDVACARRSLG